MDTTEPKPTEKRLQGRENELYTQLFNNITCGVAVYTVVGEAEDFVFKDLNPAGAIIERIRREDVIGRRVSEAFPGIQEMGLFEVFQRVWRTGKPETYPAAMYKDERLTQWVENHVYKLPTGDLVALFNDVTERKQAAEELEKSEARYALAQRIAHAGTWDWNLVTGSVYWSEETQEMWGFRPGEFKGTFDEVAQRLHPEDLEHWQESVRACLQGDKEHDIQFRIIRPDGEVRWISALGNIQRNEQGKAVRMLGMVLDITERRLHEDERRSLEEQLRQVQKMETLGQLAGGIAHDFNNILQGVLGYSELILKTLDRDSKEYEFMSEVHESAKRAAALTRQLLAFSRRQILEPKDVDLNEIVGGLLNMIGRTIGEQIELSFRPGRSIGAVRADAGQLEQVVINLCLNARDAMPKGGRLSIETKNVRFDEQYCKGHPEALPGDYAMLAVSDTGCGMNEETKAHAFEPFFTTKEKGKGTGLGLATVYGIVKQHNGTISLYSEPGKGTVFKIYLPTVVPKEAGVEPQAPEVRFQGTETILLAEDDETVRRLTTQLLKKAGYRVIVARDGNEAIELGRQHIDKIDLALLDVVMPKQGGADVYEALLKLKPGLPTIFYSGYGTEALNIDPLVNRGAAFIQKPFSSDMLLRKIREMCESA